MMCGSRTDGSTGKRIASTNTPSLLPKKWCTSAGSTSAARAMARSDAPS